MPRVDKQLYIKAAKNVMQRAGFNIKDLSKSQFLAENSDSRLYVDVAGKNLPYFGKQGQEAFFWETHIQPKRLDKIEAMAIAQNAKPWLAFSYVILDPELNSKFKSVIHLDDKVFGIRLISIADFRAHMQPRSPSWEVVELPRKSVLALTIEPHQIIPQEPDNVLNHLSVVHRKYGSGGEGQDHKKLKERIAANPEIIGITNCLRANIEHLFLSGDSVDILFELKDGNNIVAEIETVDPEPGAHQAIKYRSLRCAQLGLKLDSSKVKAYLIAWEIPTNVKEFCNKYNVVAVETR